jgi:hypothetical protein
MGKSAYRKRATSAGTIPIPKSGIINARRAMDGIV